ncbi:toprim domain-containing protein [Pseudomonas proteolytica]|uniref:Toprim domain-containing protein n=1 Tax=Pseudomonas proteolytica TaxID=219574 RepID=A0AAW4ZW69_9PSED|nr:PriCT-2 domain-containing protein [Pseudomonas proteolytica]MCF5056769.1 toprim domain-containing protein [Pseudomonas proteolytica]MCF5103679.1 toprim domain-containing protein [Pseudomonas proteolytica]
MSDDKIPLQLSDLPHLLQYISPDSRDTWVEVGMGLKAEFGQDGYGPWNVWSQSSKSYDGKAALTVWKSFKRVGTSMGTVLKQALDAGWRPEKTEMTAEEKKRFAVEAEARRKLRQAEVEADEALLEEMRALVAESCQRIWDEHCQADGKSAYLDRKQVGAFGIGFFNTTVVLSIDDHNKRCQVWSGSSTMQFFNSLPKPRPASLSFLMFKPGGVAIPLRDFAGKLWSLQSINGQGTKLFPKYGRKSGCFHVLGVVDSPAVVAVAEGYATAASIHMSSGWPVAMAVDSGNLVNVARSVRAIYPDANIVIAGDDDPNAPGNPGRTKAEAAALEVGGFAAFPDFGEAA